MTAKKILSVFTVKKLWRPRQNGAHCAQTQIDLSGPVERKFLRTEVDISISIMARDSAVIFFPMYSRTRLVGQLSSHNAISRCLKLRVHVKEKVLKTFYMCFIIHVTTSETEIKFQPLKSFRILPDFCKTVVTIKMCCRVVKHLYQLQLLLFLCQM